MTSIRTRPYAASSGAGDGADSRPVKEPAHGERHLGPAEAARAHAAARRAAIHRLLTAADGLAATIAATEELAQQRADILVRRSTVLGTARDGAFGGPVISLAEAARRTGRHPEVLRRWCLEGRIEGIRVGRTWGITPETLAMLLAHAGRSRPRFPTSSSA